MADTPILLLPDDVLVEIFTHHQKLLLCGPGAKLGAKEHTHTMISWVPAITHVCRRWRNLAIGSPLLWTDIILMSPNCVVAFLERCGQAPLRVKGQIEGDSTIAHAAGTLGRVLTRSNQIASLELSLPNALPSLATFAQPRPHFAQLLHLKLRTPLRLEQGLPIYDVPPIPLPTFLNSSSQFPHLRELSLSGYPFCQLQQLLSSKLTKLTLEEFLDFHESHDDFGLPDLLAALSDLPLLEELTLGEGVPLLGLDGGGELSELPMYAHSISLPKLRRFCMRSGGKECAAFLNHVTLPPQAQLSLSLWAPWGMGLRERNDKLLPFIIGPIARKYLSYSDGCGARKIKALAIEAGWKSADPIDPNNIMLRMWPSSLPTSTIPGSAKDFQEEDAPFTMRILDYSGSRILQSICDDLPLHTVQTAYVGTRPRAENPICIPPDIEQVSLLHERMADAQFFTGD